MNLSRLEMVVANVVGGVVAFARGYGLVAGVQYVAARLCH